MTKKLFTVTAVALALASPAFSKAHDQGRAHFGDEAPNFEPGGAAGVVDDVVRDGVLAIPAEDPDVPGKARGEQARGSKGDNRTSPVFKE